MYCRRVERKVTRKPGALEEVGPEVGGRENLLEVGGIHGVIGGYVENDPEKTRNGHSAETDKCKKGVEFDEGDQELTQVIAQDLDGEEEAGFSNCGKTELGLSEKSGYGGPGLGKVEVNWKGLAEGAVGGRENGKWRD